MFNFFILFCLYLPFQVALNPVLGVDLASIRILILIFFAVWVFFGVRDKKNILFLNIQAKLVVAFLVLSLISMFFAQNLDWSIRKFIYLISIFPVYFIARNILNGKERRLKVLKSLVFSGAGLSFLGIVQFFSQFFWSHDKIHHFYVKFVGPTFWGESLTQMVAEHSSWLVSISNRNYFRAISIFPDPHTFSLFLGMLIPIALCLFFFLEQKKVWFFCFSMILLADILTFSRGAYLGLIFGALVFIVAGWKKMNARNKFIISGIMILFFLIFAINPVSQRFLSSFNLKEGSNLGRIKMWKEAVLIISQKPFFGTGLGNFSLEINDDVRYRNPIYAHNTYLDIAAEEGILAGFIWLLIIAVTLRKFWIFSKKDSLYIGLFLSLVIFSVHSLVETGIYSPMVLSLFLILISFYPQYESQ